MTTPIAQGPCGLPGSAALDILDCLQDRPVASGQAVLGKCVKAPPEHGQRGPQCECGGYTTWCSHCRVWSRTCCVEYGTCQCS
jgi:hypothetical protein